MSTMKNPEDVRNYINAGKATVTLKSNKTGTHYTYKVKKKEKISFVSLLTSPEEYTYIGVLDGNGFRTTTKSKMTDESTPVRAFKFFHQNITHNLIPDSLEIRHSGKCGCCGRELTTPDSVDTGLGPICRKKMGL